jgi:recombinational DNA repair ATPase RecF
MTVLFLTFSSLALCLESTRQDPILLLDDVDAELDLGILQRMLIYLRGKAQIFATSAKAPLVKTIDFGPHRQFTLRGGRAIATNDVHS